MLIGPLTNFSEILIEIQTFSLKKICLKMSSANYRPFCLGLNVLNIKMCLEITYQNLLPHLPGANVLKCAEGLRCISMQSQAKYPSNSRCVLLPAHSCMYCQISNISHTLIGNTIVDHSNVGTAPTTSSFPTYHPTSIDCTETTARRDKRHLSFVIWCALY